MKSGLIALATLAISLSVLPPSHSGEQDKKADEKDKASVWMQKKLEFSQNIFAGLTEGDYEKIHKNAQAMNVLSYFEKWARADRADYKKLVVFFDVSNQELIRQAREKNLDGATLAYNQLTVSCVQCHRIVRDAKK